MADLETLEAVAGFSLLSNDIEHPVDELGAFGVVTLRPVITSTRLTKNKVIRSENLTVRT